MPSPDQVRRQFELQRRLAPATQGELERAEARIMLRLDVMFALLTKGPPLSQLIRESMPDEP
jgi:hypothetical protein